MKAVLDLVPDQIKYAKALKEKGKIVAEYIIGKNEGFGILDVESQEELNEILAKTPSSSIVSHEVIPLIDFEQSLEVWKELIEKAVK